MKCITKHASPKLEDYGAGAVVRVQDREFMRFGNHTQSSGSFSSSFLGARASRPQLDAKHKHRLLRTLRAGRPRTQGRA
jgi:hypothetical protein